MNAKTLLGSVCLVCSALLLLSGGWMLTFGIFRFYDDEGTLLMIFRDLARLGHLYDQVPTPYGPLYQIFYKILHLLGVPFTHVGGRWVTFLCWVIASGLLGLLVKRTTQNSLLAATGVAMSAVYLWPILAEPSHPVAMILLIVTAMATFGSSLLENKKYNKWIIVSALGASCLFFIKINMGIFSIFAIGLFWMIRFLAPSLGKGIKWLGLFSVVLLPLGLMGSLISLPWVQIYATLFILGLLPLLWVAFSLDRERVACWGILLCAVIVFALVAAISLLFVIATGGTLAGMQRVIFGFAFNIANKVSVPLVWPKLALTGAVMSLGFYLIMGGLRRFQRPELADIMIFALRVLLGLWCWIGMITLSFAETLSPLIPYDLHANFMAFAPALLWCAVYPLPGRNQAATDARLWIALLMGGLWLTAYSTATSNTLSIASFLLIPLLLLSSHDAFIWLKEQYPSFTDALKKYATSAAALLLVFVFCLASKFFLMASPWLDHRYALSLPSAESLRLSDRETVLYRTFALNAKIHGDGLFSFPQYLSYNLWANLPAPTTMSCGLWFVFFDEQRRQEVIQQMESYSRPLLIMNYSGIDHFKADRGLKDSDILYKYLNDNYQPAFALGGFGFNVKKGRKIAPMYLANMKYSPLAQAAVFHFNVPLLKEQPINEIELAVMDDPEARIVKLNKKNSRVFITPISLTGEATGPRREMPFPVTFDGPATVEVETRGIDLPAPEGTRILVLRDPQGKEMGLMFAIPR